MTSRSETHGAEPNDVVIRGGLVMPMVRPHEWFLGDISIRDGRIDKIENREELSISLGTIDAR